MSIPPIGGRPASRCVARKSGVLGEPREGVASQPCPFHSKPHLYLHYFTPCTCSLPHSLPGPLLLLFQGLAPHLLPQPALHVTLAQKRGVTLLRPHSHPPQTTLPPTGPTGPAAAVCKSSSLRPWTARPWRRRTSPEQCQAPGRGTEGQRRTSGESEWRWG